MSTTYGNPPSLTGQDVSFSKDDFTGALAADFPITIPLTCIPPLFPATHPHAAPHYRELAIRQDARLAIEAGAQADHAHHGFGGLESATVARAALLPQQAA